MSQVKHKGAGCVSDVTRLREKGGLLPNRVFQGAYMLGRTIGIRDGEAVSAAHHGRVCGDYPARMTRKTGAARALAKVMVTVAAARTLVTSAGRKQAMQVPAGWRTAG